MFDNKEYILKIHEKQSFSKAAEDLYMSQPALSAIVKRTENKIGEPLFDRSKSPIELTECGKEYVKIAREMIAAEDRFKSHLIAHRQCLTGNLSIGGSNMNVSYVLPPLLQLFRELYPGIHINIVEGNIGDLKVMLEKGSIDLLVDSFKADPSQFTSYFYKKESLILATPASFSCNTGLEKYQLTLQDIIDNKHLLDDTPAIPLKHFENIPFISYTSETDTFYRSKDIFKDIDFQPNIIHDFCQQSTVYNYISAQMGIGFISDTIAKNSYFFPDLIYYRIGDARCLRSINFYQNRKKQMTYAMQAFLQLAHMD